MIPKVIHYVWLGQKEKGELEKKCIESWEKKLPDYEIIEWNESNFDVSSNIFVKEAYEAKKYAFASDYIRLYVLYTYGGIYMDTDVEIKKNIDNFLMLKAFSGFESKNSVPTGIMGTEKGLPIFKELLAYYENRHFIKSNGENDEVTNVVVISEILKEYGLVLNNRKQTVEGITMFPKDYFCPKDVKTLKMKITENTYAIHHFSGSWQSKRKKIRRIVMARVRRILGPKLTEILENIEDKIRYRTR